MSKDRDRRSFGKAAALPANLLRCILVVGMPIVLGGAECANYNLTTSAQSGDWVRANATCEALNLGASCHIYANCVAYALDLAGFAFCDNNLAVGNYGGGPIMYMPPVLCSVSPDIPCPAAVAPASRIDQMRNCLRHDDASFCLTDGTKLLVNPGPPLSDPDLNTSLFENASP